MGRPKSNRDDVAVKVDRQVILEAKVVAAFRNVSVAEYLSDLLAPAVSADLAKHKKGEVKKGKSTPPEPTP